jgi:hypothetical protein
MLALLPAHHQTVGSLVVAPQAFSPRVTTLRVTGRLPRARVAGPELATPNGHRLGWLVRPRRRRRLAYAWHGRMHGRPVRDGRYALRIVAGKHVLARAPFRLDTTAPLVAGFDASNGGRPFSGDGRC